jgi:hypothetical protein
LNSALAGMVNANRAAASNNNRFMNGSLVLVFVR